jgi:hypothetical protein
MVIVVVSGQTTAAQSIICFPVFADNFVHLAVVAKALQNAVYRYPVHFFRQLTFNIFMAKRRS